MNASWDKRKLTEKPYSLAKTGTLGRMCKIAEPTERRMRQWLKHDLLLRLTSYVTLRSSTAELLNTWYWCPSHIPLPLAATNQVRAMKKKRGTETHELMFRAFATAGLAQRLSARNSTPLMWVSFPFGLASFEHVPSLDSANIIGIQSLSKECRSLHSWVEQSPEGAVGYSCVHRAWWGTQWSL